MRKSEVLQVAAGVVVENNLILITQRWNGRWEFPGGKIEPGESAEQALIRELEEELAVRVVVDGRLGLVTHSYPDRVVALHTFFCHLINSRPKPIGICDWRWVTQSHLTGFDFLEADLKILSLLKKSRV